MKIKAENRKILFPILLAALYIIATLIVSAVASPLRTSDVNISNFTSQIWNDSVQLLLILPFSLFYYKDSNCRAREVTAWRKTVTLVIGLCLILFAVVLVALRFSFNRVYASLYYLLIVAAGEEYVFRGYLYGKLKEISSSWRAIILSGIIYGAAHGPFQHFVLRQSWIVVPSNLGGGIIGALLFVFLFEKSGTILIPILFHWVIDLCGYIL